MRDELTGCAMSLQQSSWKGTSSGVASIDFLVAPPGWLNPYKTSRQGGPRGYNKCWRPCLDAIERLSVPTVLRVASTPRCALAK